MVRTEGRSGRIKLRFNRAGVDASWAVVCFATWLYILTYVTVLKLKYGRFV